jgi:hypothetical protein
MVVAVSTPSDDQLVKDCEKALDREQPAVATLVKAYGSKVGALLAALPHPLHVTGHVRFRGVSGSHAHLP